MNREFSVLSSTFTSSSSELKVSPFFSVLCSHQKYFASSWKCCKHLRSTKQYPKVTFGYLLLAIQARQMGFKFLKHSTETFRDSLKNNFRSFCIISWKIREVRSIFTEWMSNSYTNLTLIISLKLEISEIDNNSTVASDVI